MVNNIQMLISLCKQELDSREYSPKLKENIQNTWLELETWMNGIGHEIFTEKVGFKFCDQTFGWHDLTRPIKQQDRIGLRAIRMLTSYQKDGDFEFRTPSVIRKFSGSTGKYMDRYLAYLQDDVELKCSTISNKRRYLVLFNEYMEARKFEYFDITVELIANFYQSQSFSLASKHNCNSTLRLFLRYLFDIGVTVTDYSICIMPDNYKKSRKLPTTYEESEIKELIQAIERGSAIGKRDYLVILLAAQYGWRASDIVSFSFKQINWDKNLISLNQQKTNVSVNYPLISSVGNAIIDYLKNGRPYTKASEVIVSHEISNKGKKLNKATIHSIVSKYMRKADIKNWEIKKHGPHSLRHSLATNMLKRNISIPIISTVLGHQNTESTKIYLSIDYDQLRKCSLSVPPVRSKYFHGGEDYE